MSALTDPGPSSPAASPAASPSDAPLAPRRRVLSLVTLVVLVVFALVTVVTSAVSFGSYCLTTDGADAREIPTEYRLPTGDR